MGNEIAKRESNPVGMISDIGDGSVFVKKTESGFVRATSAFVTLSKDKGHLYTITKNSNDHSITKAGLDHMNKIAGVSIITPSTLMIPTPDGRGMVVPNPYPIPDPDTGSISKVWVKKTAIGFGPTGNLAMTSRTLLYDIDMYFVQDITKKIQYNKQAGRFCMKQSITPKDLETGIFVEIRKGLGVWADAQNEDILKALETYIQNKLFAERKAQTICERNAMKSHPALSTGTKIQTDKNGLAAVKVIGWVSDFTEKELRELQKKAEASNLMQEGSIALDGAMDIDDRIHTVDEEDLAEPADEPEETIIENTPDDEPLDNVGQEPQGTDPEDTRNLDDTYEAYEMKNGAVGVAKIIKQNFGGKKWAELTKVEKATAINRLNSSELKKP